MDKMIKGKYCCCATGRLASWCYIVCEYSFTIVKFLIALIKQ